MQLLKDNEVEEVLEFLKADMGKCLYMYIDISTYGVGNDVVVWRNSQAELRTVLMKYHDSLQLYSSGIKGERGNLLELISELNVSMISGEKMLIQDLMKDIDMEYKVTEGIVHEIPTFKEYEKPEGFGVAAEDDMYELAELVCQDEGVGGHYEVANLSKQYVERLKTGMGRNYYIKKNGVICAHAATYAETDELAITSGLVAKKCESFGYGIIVEGCLVNDLLKEGKRIFTFTTSPIRDKYLKLMGAVQCGEYIKMVK